MRQETARKQSARQETARQPAVSSSGSPAGQNPPSFGYSAASSGGYPASSAPAPTSDSQQSAYSRESTSAGLDDYRPNPTVSSAPSAATAGQPSAADAAAPRVARLTIASIDPFSALKLSFLLSVAAGIALVIAVVVLWLVLDSIGVFDQLNDVLGDLGLNTTTKKFDIYKYVGLGKVLSISIVIAVINAAILTALATLSAFLYNLSAGLVGGVRVTLSDD
jgi:hypothetical protein